MAFIFDTRKGPIIITIFFIENTIIRFWNFYLEFKIQYTMESQVQINIERSIQFLKSEIRDLEIRM